METIIVSIAGAILGLLWLREKRKRDKAEELQVFTEKAYRNTFDEFQKAKKAYENLSEELRTGKDYVHLFNKYDQLKKLYMSKMKVLAEKGMIKCDCKEERIVHHFGDGREFSVPIQNPKMLKIADPPKYIPGVAYGIFPYIKRTPPHNID